MIRGCVGLTPGPMCPPAWAGQDGESCLTAAQADRCDEGLRWPVSHGKSLFPGFMFGSEAVVHAAFGGGSDLSGWMNVIVPAQAGQNSADFNLAEGIMRYLCMCRRSRSMTTWGSITTTMLAPWRRGGRKPMLRIPTWRHSGIEAANFS